MSIVMRSMETRPTIGARRSADIGAAAIGSGRAESRPHSRHRPSPAAPAARSGGSHHSQRSARVNARTCRIFACSRTTWRIGLGWSGERREAVERGARTDQIESVVGPEEDAGGGGEAARHALRQRQPRQRIAKPLGLLTVQRMLRLVGAGESGSSRGSDAGASACGRSATRCVEFVRAAGRGAPCRYRDAAPARASALSPRRRRASCRPRRDSRAPAAGQRPRSQPAPRHADPPVHR